MADTVKRSNEGGRQVNLGEGGGSGGEDEGTARSASAGNGRGARSREHNIGSEPNRVEPAAGFPGAAESESVAYMIESAAERIAQHSPTYQAHKTDVASKLRDAIKSICD